MLAQLFKASFRLIAPNFWYHRTFCSYLLLPFSIIYLLIINIRRLYYWIKPQQHITIPILVVGNITTGGSGKTPLVIALIKFFQQHNYRPAVVSRGYGSQNKQFPYFVHANSSADQVGEEVLLIARHTNVPVCVAINRTQAAVAICQYTDCNLIISDDGLQHYALKRDLEIAVIDQTIGYGNGFCLPAGPLREPPTRLTSVDLVVHNYNSQLTTPTVVNAQQKSLALFPSSRTNLMATTNHCPAKFKQLLWNSLKLTQMHRSQHVNMQLVPQFFYNLTAPQLRKELQAFHNQTVHAIAGIGNPTRFFQTLTELGLRLIEHSFADHHIFQLTELRFAEEYPIIMTEKDAIKCENFPLTNCWVLVIEAMLYPTDHPNYRVGNIVNARPTCNKSA